MEAGLAKKAAWNEATGSCRVKGKSARGSFSIIPYEEGTIIATRSTGTADERKAVKKALEVKVADLFAEQEPESLKVMASKQELKAKLERLMRKAIDEHFGKY